MFHYSNEILIAIFGVFGMFVNDTQIMKMKPIKGEKDLQNAAFKHFGIPNHGVCMTLKVQKLV